MKKHTIMLEDEHLIHLSGPVPHGIQKQFPISKGLNMHKWLLIFPLGLGLAALLCGLAIPSALQAQDQVGPGWNGFDTVSGTIL